MCWISCTTDTWVLPNVESARSNPCGGQELASTQIQDLIKNCHTCERYYKNKPEPLNPLPFPGRPWQIVAVDFFKCENKEHLLVVDCFSRYIELSPMNKKKTSTEEYTIHILRKKLLVLSHILLKTSKFILSV